MKTNNISLKVPPFNYQYLFLLLSISFIIGACGKESKPQTEPEPNPEVGVVIPEWKVGDVFYDKNKWTEAVVGNMPLIISVPHGGQLQPASVPNRSCANATTVTDLYTIELAREISKSMKEKYNVQPYIVFCHLKRTKIDQNRDLAEATCGNTAMAAPWHLFHNYIDTAINHAVSKFGAALYIDLHGHGHSNQRLELGYSLSKEELRDVSQLTNLEPLWKKSTLNNLKSIKNGQDFRDYMMGDLAFGTMMETEGFASVPAKLDPYPKTDESYFTGGYNTKLYTAGKYPKAFGWQIEANMNGVRDNAGRPLFADAFSTVIMQYLKNTMQYVP